MLVQAREGQSPIQSRQDIEDVQVPAGEAVDIFYRSIDLHSLTCVSTENVLLKVRIFLAVCPRSAEG